MSGPDFVFVGNPTAAAITVAGVSVPSKQVREIELKLEAAENGDALLKAVGAGCAVTPASLTNAAASVAAHDAKINTALTVAEGGAAVLNSGIRPADQNSTSGEQADVGWGR